VLALMWAPELTLSLASVFSLPKRELVGPTPNCPPRFAGCKQSGAFAFSVAFPKVFPTHHRDFGCGCNLQRRPRFFAPV